MATTFNCWIGVIHGGILAPRTFPNDTQGLELAQEYAEVICDEVSVRTCYVVRVMEIARPRIAKVMERIGNKILDEVYQK